MRTLCFVYRAQVAQAIAVKAAVEVVAAFLAVLETEKVRAAVLVFAALVVVVAEERGVEELAELALSGVVAKVLSEAPSVAAFLSRV